MELRPEHYESIMERSLKAVRHLLNANAKRKYILITIADAVSAESKMVGSAAVWDIRPAITTPHDEEIARAFDEFDQAKEILIVITSERASRRFYVRPLPWAT